jgi:hypothetical protein
VLGWRSFPAAGDGFYHVMGCGAAPARAHGGDPQASGPPLMVGKSAVRAGNAPPRLGGECWDDESPAAVMAIITAQGPRLARNATSAEPGSCLSPASQVRDSIAPVTSARPGI